MKAKLEPSWHSTVSTVLALHQLVYARLIEKVQGRVWSVVESLEDADSVGRIGP